MTDHTNLTIAVTGATGFVGRHLVAELLRRGHTVRALARDADKAKRVLPDSTNLHITTGDILDGKSPEALTKGTDAVIHLIGIIREALGRQTFQRMHVEATRAIVRAAEDNGVRRYIHMSALGVSPEGPSKYQKTKFEAERIVTRSILDWTIFRPGLIHGPDGDFFQQMKRWCEGRELPYLFLPYFTRVEIDIPPKPTEPPKFIAPTVAPVHVEDVAKAFADALTTPETVAEIYPLSGPENIRFPDMLRAVRDALPQGKKESKAIAMPGPIAVAKAFTWKLVGLEKAMPFDIGMAQMGQQDSLCELDKAKAHLNFEPRPFVETMKAYAPTA